jgi:hypothetical protein
VLRGTVVHRDDLLFFAVVLFSEPAELLAVDAILSGGMVEEEVVGEPPIESSAPLAPEDADDDDDDE